MTWCKKVKTSLVVLAGCTMLWGCASKDESLMPAPVPQLAQTEAVSVAWQQDIGSDDGFFSQLKPSIAYGKVFSSSRGGDVFAFDKNTGKEIWSTDVRLIPNGFWQTFWFDDEKTARVSGGLSAAYEKVFLGTEDGEVLALSESNGEILWRVKVKGEVLSAPLLEDGQVFVQTSAGFIYALDALDGKQNWEIESEVPSLTIRGNASLKYSSGGIIVGGANGKVSVYLSATGQLAWQTPVAKPQGSTELERIVDVDSDPLIIGTNLYGLSYGGTLAAIELRNGRLVWKREYAGFQSMTNHVNSLILSDKSSNLYSIDRRTGVERWSSSELLNRTLSSPVMQKGRIVVGDFEGYLHWLDVENGKITAQLELDDALFSSGVIDDGRLYIQSTEGTLFAVDLKK